MGLVKRSGRLLVSLLALPIMAALTPPNIVLIVSDDLVWIIVLFYSLMIYWDIFFIGLCLLILRQKIVMLEIIFFYFLSIFFKQFNLIFLLIEIN